MTTRLKDRLRELAQRHDPKACAHYARLAAFVERIGQLEQRLQPGDVAPDFALPTNENRTVRLSDLLKRGPLVLFFVRGLWCPFCAAQLSATVNMADDFAKAGLGIAVVTPETAGRAGKLAERHQTSFPVFCDVDMGVALSYGCLFPVPPDEQQHLASRGIDLTRYSGSGAWFMPLPTAFGIGRDGRIIRVHGAADPRERPEPADMLEDLSQALAAESS